MLQFDALQIASRAMTERIAEDTRYAGLLPAGLPSRRRRGMAQMRARVAGALLGLARVVEPTLMNVEIAAGQSRTTR